MQLLYCLHSEAIRQTGPARLKARPAHARQALRFLRERRAYFVENPGGVRADWKRPHGFGSLPLNQVLGRIPELFSMAAAVRLRVGVDRVPLARSRRPESGRKRDCGSFLR
jgi:hypothetical protein